MGEIDNAGKRMPAILREEDHHVWLGWGRTGGTSRATGVSSDSMVAWPVGPEVNSPENDDETLMAPRVAV